MLVAVRHGHRAAERCRPFDQSVGDLCVRGTVLVGASMHQHEHAVAVRRRGCIEDLVDLRNVGHVAFVHLQETKILFGRVSSTQLWLPFELPTTWIAPKDSLKRVFST